MYKNSTNKRFIFTIVAIIILAISSGVVYAYWDSLTKKNDVHIGIGEGIELMVDVTEQCEGRLVPRTARLKDGDITEVVLKFNATLSSAIKDPATLRVEATFTQDFGDLFNIDISHSETITSEEEITIKISFAREPENQVEYNLVANQNLVLSVYISVS